MTESLAAVLPDDIFTVGTNQNDAILIRTDMQYRGHLDSGYGWLAFRTGDMPDTRYTFSVQNITPGSQIYLLYQRFLNSFCFFVSLPFTRGGRYVILS